MELEREISSTMCLFLLLCRFSRVFFNSLLMKFPTARMLLWCITSSQRSSFEAQRNNAVWRAVKPGRLRKSHPASTLTALQILINIPPTIERCASTRPAVHVSRLVSCQQPQRHEMQQLRCPLPLMSPEM